MKKKSYDEYLLYGLLIFVSIIVMFTFTSFFVSLPTSDDQPKKMNMRMTSFDIALAKKFMDKNSDGICDSCGMNVDDCIAGGMMECSMDPTAKIGTLGSAHIHVSFKVYDQGKHMSFAQQKYFVQSMFVHVEPETNAQKTGEIIHVHATGIPLSLFFDSIEMDMNKFHLFVNGQPQEYALYVPKDKDKVLLTTTTDPAVIQKEMDSIIDL